MAATEKPHVWLRSETKSNEARSLLSPAACADLCRHGYTVTVESCPQRIFKDADYEAYVTV